MKKFLSLTLIVMLLLLGSAFASVFQDDVNAIIPVIAEIAEANDTNVYLTENDPAKDASHSEYFSVYHNQDKTFFATFIGNEDGIKRVEFAIFDEQQYIDGYLYAMFLVHGYYGYVDDALLNSAYLSAMNVASMHLRGPVQATHMVNEEMVITFGMDAVSEHADPFMLCTVQMPEPAPEQEAADILCSACGGTGTVSTYNNCFLCSGSGVLGDTCPTCKGAIVCSRCKGAGNLTEYDVILDINEEKVCGICEGDGICLECGGTGKYMCFLCDATGKTVANSTVCEACGGFGFDFQ